MKETWIIHMNFVRNYRTFICIMTKKAGTVKQIKNLKVKKELEEPNGFLIEHFPAQRTKLISFKRNYKVT